MYRAKDKGFGEISERRGITVYCRGNFWDSLEKHFIKINGWSLKMMTYLFFFSMKLTNLLFKVYDIKLIYFKVGDTVGIGSIVDTCWDCESCKSAEEQFCDKGIYNCF